MERQILFHTGFETGEEGLYHRGDDGEVTVNFIGPSEERSFKGKSSFKIDITFKTGTWSYWQTKLSLIPFAGSPRVRGALYVEQGGCMQSAIGFDWGDLDLGTSGHVSNCLKVQQHPSGWSEWETNIKPTASDTDHIEAVAIHIRACPGERIVLFVDELEVEGTPFPSDYEKRLKERIQERADVEKEKRQIEFQSWLDELKEQLEKTKNVFSEPRLPLPAASASWLQKIDKELSAYCKNKLPPLQNELERLAKQGGTGWELGSIQNQLRYLQFGLTSYYNLPDYAKTYRGRPFLVYIVPAIRNEKIIPASFPVPGVIGTDLSLSACPDEYGPVSFAIYAAEDLKEVKISASTLSPSFSFPNRELLPRVDLFLVKCWWQGGGEGIDTPDIEHPILTPELLLKDPELVEVDNIKKRNKLKNPEAPQDAKTLQPVIIPEGTLQQYWVTVYIPKNTPAGTYKGSLKVEISGTPGITLPLSVEVLPFQLEPPILEYAIEYRGTLFDPAGKNSFSTYYRRTETEPRFDDSTLKSAQLYLADMLDLKAHGIELPSVFDDMQENPDGTLDFSHLRRVWELRKKAGLTKGPILKVRTGVPVSEYATEKDPVKRKEILKKISERVKQWLEFVKESGFPTPLFFGIDEASGDLLGAQREAYKAIQDAGGKTGVQIGSGFFRWVGDVMDRPIVNGSISKAELKMVHDKGYKVWVYHNPHLGHEAPETYRRTHGLWLWKEGYDGTCNWAYQDGYGDSHWDDFDCPPNERDRMMTYPTIDGVISTIQWEGFREGYNDVRYLSTLLKLIEKAKTKEKTRSLAKEGEEWLKKVNINGNLDLVRKEMVKRILQLSQILGNV